MDILKRCRFVLFAALWLAFLMCAERWRADKFALIVVMVHCWLPVRTLAEAAVGGDRKTTEGELSIVILGAKEMLRVIFLIHQSNSSFGRPVCLNISERICCFRGRIFCAKVNILREYIIIKSIRLESNIFERIKNEIIPSPPRGYIPIGKISYVSSITLGDNNRRLNVI